MLIVSVKPDRVYFMWLAKLRQKPNGAAFVLYDKVIQLPDYFNGNRWQMIQRITCC